ncbi:FtsK/SpoIIIE domain-containing protein [Alicyclobacillus vulcanalis]|uniref:FtsK/SpoIIIE family protein n=1 Tax=Alicyclobacillus vulcanalis TaxID=252246 RepID=A0A1N7PFK2_9BACL|nr:FtsK/SpoIIIE domain-containing protein [Alicyclobacillus vulcanalis]SIT09317.1 FtsK/SpoIIIE family protein [Alicyclobacillus vulcanalis]
MALRNPQVSFRLGRLKRRGRALVGLYRLPPGESFASLQEKERELASALGEQVQITQTAWPGCVEIARFPALPRTVSLSDALPVIRKANEFSWCLGEGVQGPVLVPLREYPHLLVAGATGGGKTNALKVIAETLKVQRPDATVVIADLKGGYDYKPLLDTVDEVIRDLDRLHVWMQQLVTTLTEREQEAWERGTTHFTPCVTLIDEFATVTSTANSKVDKETAEMAKAILAMVNTILQKGRSLGLHLVIATQRPDAETIPGTLRANMDALLTFHVTTQVQSGVVLGPGHNEAFELPPIPGRALVSLGGSWNRCRYFDGSVDITSIFNIRRRRSWALRSASRSGASVDAWMMKLPPGPSSAFLARRNSRPTSRGGSCTSRMVN